MSRDLGFTVEVHRGQHYMMFYCKKTGETLLHKHIGGSDGGSAADVQLDNEHDRSGDSQD
jgi:hypothetical protein